jgi:antiviral helicase SKI2
VLLKKVSPIVLGSRAVQQHAYFALALVDPMTKSGANGNYTYRGKRTWLLKPYTDIEPASLPPLWIINPGKMVVDERTYDVKAIPISSIIRVCNRMIKVHYPIFGP